MTAHTPTTSFTPGPWVVLNTGTINAIVPAMREGMIADLIDNDANARLIAAAPELAADLRSLRDLAAMVLNRQHAGQPIADRIWSDLYAAINKAGGTLAKAEETAP